MPYFTAQRALVSSPYGGYPKEDIDSMTKQIDDDVSYEGYNNQFG